MQIPSLLCLIISAIAASGPSALASTNSSTPGLVGVAQGEVGLVAVTQTGVLMFRRDEDAIWTAPRFPRNLFFRSVVYGNGVFVAVGGSYLLPQATVAISGDGRRWRLRALADKQVLRAAGFNRGLFMIVGDEGAIFISANGNDWQKRVAPTRDDLVAIAAGRQSWVVGTSAGAILASFDGASWSEWVHPARSSFRTIAWTGTAFEACPYIGETLESADGVSWSTAEYRR